MVHQGQDGPGAWVQGHEGAGIAAQGGMGRPLERQVQGEINVRMLVANRQVLQQAAGSAEGVAHLRNLHHRRTIGQLVSIDGTSAAVEEQVGSSLPFPFLQEFAQKRGAL